MSKQQDPQIGTDVLQHFVDSSIMDLLDKDVVVFTKQHNYRGRLVTFDQYLNIQLVNTKKIWIHDGKYAEEPAGVVMIRTDHVALMGLADYSTMNKLQRIEVDQMLELLKADEDKLVTFEFL